MQLNKIVLNSEFEFMRPVLKCWFKYIQAYIDAFKGEDLPYWYNERANVGVLASAAWNAEFVALEEYQIDKKSKDGKLRKGRNDLYICHGDEQGICIEAKVLFHSIKTDYKEKIESKLKEALDDAGQIYCDSDDNRKVGAVFVCPYCKSSESGNIDSEINKFISVIEGIEAPVKCWVFPVEAKNSQSIHKIPRSYLGVVLLMREIGK